MTEHLYRYLRIPQHEDDRSPLIDLLQKDLIGFSSPLRFNDPFDSKALFTFEGSAEEDFRTFYTARWKHETPELSDDEVKCRVDAMIEAGCHANPELLQEQKDMWSGALHELLEDTGVICFSEVCDDILMWSHYAYGHQGVCLQFDRSILERECYCRPVEYSDQFPRFKDFVALPDDDKANLILFRKAGKWKYEKEWRVIALFQEEKEPERHSPHQLPQGCLKGVILGCAMEDEMKDLVKSLVAGRQEQSQIDVYEARTHPNDYRILIPGITEHDGESL